MFFFLSDFPLKDHHLPRQARDNRKGVDETRDRFAQAAAGIAVFTENVTLWNTSINRWRLQAPAYVYIKADGPTPKRPPLQRYLAHTGPVCDPACTDKAMNNYWHGQSVWGVRDGLCQETCRDLGHVQLGAQAENGTPPFWYHVLRL